MFFPLESEKQKFENRNRSKTTNIEVVIDAVQEKVIFIFIWLYWKIQFLMI